jgi:hypothetical protein
MEILNRIPELREASFDGALTWFSDMKVANLLFHPDDDPAEIIRIKTGHKMFSEVESSILRTIIDTLDLAIGHDSVIEAAYPIFMNCTGIQLDS